MFSGAAKVMGDITGTTDNCIVYPKEKVLDNTSFSGFILKSETPYFLFKSLKKEFLFTDRSMISVVGGLASGTKRTVKRFNYVDSIFDDVEFETAGINDFDCELKFLISNQWFSIDIKKAETESAIPYYRFLSELSVEQQRLRKLYKLNEAVLLKTVLNGNTVTVDSDKIEEITQKYNPISMKPFFDNYFRS